MTLKTRPLRLFLQSRSGAALPGAVVKAELTTYQVDGIDVVKLTWPLAEESDAPGYYSGQIWPNTRGDGGAQYTITADAGDQRMQSQLHTFADGPADQISITMMVNPQPWPPVYPAADVVDAARVFSESAGASASLAQGAQANSQALAAQLGDIQQAVNQTNASRNSASAAAVAAENDRARAEEASNTASAVANMRPDTATALADVQIADGAYFSTPSVELGVAAAIWRKTGGVAVDTGIRVPSTALVPVMMSRETGYAWGVVDSVGRAALLIGLDGTVSIPLANIPQLGNRLTALETLPGQTAQLQSNVQTLQGLSAQVMGPETGYAWGVVDSVGRAALLIGLDGKVYAPLLSLPAGSVTRAALGSDVSPMVAQTMSSETGYAWAVVDASGRVGLGIKLDGTVVGGIVQQVPDGYVTDVKLSAQLQRQVIPHTSDVVPVVADDWRGKDASVAVRTAASGSLWRTFPVLRTQNLRGINSSGSALQFRRSSGLLIRGERDCGSWSPGSVASINSKGTVSSGTTWPPTGTFVSGDYYVYSDATTRVINSITVQRSDVLVYDGSAWQVQAAPVQFSGSGFVRSPRDWWTVSVAGTFDGVAYVVGNRITCLGFESMSGYGVYRWYKGRSGTGELYYKGTFDPATGLPAIYADGQVWQASAAGSAGSFVFAVGDYLIRESGAWGQVPTDPVTTVPSGGYVSLRCTDASEWEVRRADTSATTAGVQLTARRMTTPRQPVEGVRLLSDSMYSVSSVGSLVLSKLGRTGVVNSYGGGTSTDVRNMLEREIATGGDRYRGWLHGIWCGQNNQPSSDPAGNASTVREDVLRMASLIGARDAKFYFKSILGQRVLSWSGTRMVCAQHEDMFAGTGALYAMEQWYAAMFAGQWFSPRSVLLAVAASSSLPDPTFPGMTEAQVAASYGIVPISYFLGAAGLPVAQSSLVYRGTWSSAGLPTGGAPNDYYLRISGGTVGNLIINSAGTWVEPSFDVTHLSPAGAEVLATAEANFILSSYF